jgi:hypothetical protein
MGRETELHFDGVSWLESQNRSRTSATLLLRAKRWRTAGNGNWGSTRRGARIGAHAPVGAEASAGSSQARSVKEVGHEPAPRLDDLNLQVSKMTHVPGC